MDAKKGTRFGVPCSFREPTSKHRPAIWENMLGTVFAMNDERKIKYFDYDYEAAKAYSGVTEDERDCRLAAWKAVVYDTDGNKPRRGQMVLWCKCK